MRLWTEDISLQAERIKESQQELRALVAKAREAGESWSAIGRALGTSRQAAQQQYGTRSKPPGSPDEPPLPLFSSPLGEG